MSGYSTDIEKATQDNNYFRQVLFTGPKSQLVVMALKPSEDIGVEIHHDNDQFIRVESGRGLAIIGGQEFQLMDGSAVVIPAGAQHNIINTSTSEAMKLYTIYSPAHHPDGTIHATKADAMKAEEAEHKHG